METLFEPGGHLAGSKSTSLRMTEVQRLRAVLNTEKAQVITTDTYEIKGAALTHEGSTYLLPVAFVEKLKNEALRLDAVPQSPLELIDGPLEEKALNYSNSTDPAYWLHIPGDHDTSVAWPVYGYAADYGKGYHVTPLVAEDLPDWSNAEWLCRCAQCGRELPPSFFFRNTSGRLKGICKACTATDRLVDKIFHRAMRYRTEEEQQLLVDTRHWYEALWLRNLCPRGDYAAWCIGEAEIQDRMRIATRHKRGSAPRRPPGTSPTKIQMVKDLIKESSL